MYLINVSNGLQNFTKKVKSFTRAKRLAVWYKYQGFHVEIKEVKK